MSTEASSGQPRQLTSAELAGVIKMFRETRKWSQETLAAVSRLSVRTIQRVENGEPSDLHTRRALAGAFDAEDLDIFSKPYEIPTAEELKRAQEEFDRQHITLECAVVRSGRELGRLFETATMDLSQPAVELPRESATEFAALVDYLRDYRDCASEYSEVQKLDVYDDLQRHLDALDAEEICICCASRRTQLVGRDWPDKTPWPVTIVYILAFEKGKAPEKFAVAKKVSMAA
jgi:transcriptional regulator with XRE-family HTH domain